MPIISNLMNPGQAKTKWCPLAFVATFSASGDRLIAGCNKDSEGAIRTGAYCISNGCMAWRQVGNEGWCGAFGTPPEVQLNPERAHAEVLPSRPVAEPQKHRT